MMQYLDIKANYPDTLILFRLGDFYELFFEDAKIASKVLELVLTGKNAGVEDRIPMCGVPHHAVNQYIETLIKNGYKVFTSDIIDRVGDDTVEIIDFLDTKRIWGGDIITNPPYKLATEFVYKALESVINGAKVAMFLKLTFLETQKRKKLFQKYPPKVIYVSSSRLGCSQTGEFDENGNTVSAIAYCWFIWEKGYQGDTIIKWFN